MTAPPRPSVSVVGAVGRYPAFPGRLDPCNLQVQVTDYADVVVIRLEDEKHDDFWLELTLKLDREDELALARLADDGCPNGGS